MSTDRELLAQQRDQAVRDLLDLQRQVAEGEISREVAATLRRRYEASAAHAIESLDEAPAVEPSRSSGGPRLSSAWIAAYVTAVAIAMVAAVVVLPRYVHSRPEGGFVTGNEVAEESAQTPPAPRDLSTVTEAEMEAVLAANPNVVGMRVALARRYLDKGDFDKAAEHYGVALKQNPANPEVLAGAGWLLYRLGRTDAALRFVDQALNIDPGSPNALWYKANILLDGRNNAAGALDLLRKLATRNDLEPALRTQVQHLITVAEAGGK